MSTPTESAFPPGPSISTAGDGSNSSGGMQRGASYFFGFLITFVALLFAFVGCGVLSRRRFTARRRGRVEWNLEPWAERLDGGDVGYIPPVLMEKGWLKADDDSLWKDLIPLTAMVILPGQKPLDNIAPHRSNHPRPLSTDRRHSGRSSTTITTPPTRIGSHPSGLPHVDGRASQDQNSTITTTQRGGGEVIPGSRRHGFIHYLKPTSWLRLLTGRREGGQNEYDVANEEQGIPGSAEYGEKLNGGDIGVKEESVLQVAVMIEMPSPHASSLSSGSGKDRIPEYEIGVAQVSWQHQERIT